MTWEPVFTVEDEYDGNPRSGVANFRGRPHAYDAEFDVVLKRDTRWFYLMEIDGGLRDLAIERWNVFWRWDKDSSRAVSNDPERSAELDRLIGDRLQVDHKAALRRYGEFRVLSDDSSRLYDVRWSESASEPAR